MIFSGKTLLLCHRMTNRQKMNIHHFFLPGIFFILTSCQPKASAEVEIQSDTLAVIEEPEVVIPGECFLSVIGKDSILIQVVVDNKTVGGHLHYRFYEKDKSGGKIFGYMKGDTLIADYKFMAEGMESEREVAFIHKGDHFVEGYGDAIEKDGRMVFKDLSMVKFEGQPMQKVDCESLAWYFSK